MNSLHRWFARGLRIVYRCFLLKLKPFVANFAKTGICRRLPTTSGWSDEHTDLAGSGQHVKSIDWFSKPSATPTSCAFRSYYSLPKGGPESGQPTACSAIWRRVYIIWFSKFSSLAFTSVDISAPVRVCVSVQLSCKKFFIVHLFGSANSLSVRLLVCSSDPSGIHEIGFTFSSVHVRFVWNIFKSIIFLTCRHACVLDRLLSFSAFINVHECVHQLAFSCPFTCNWIAFQWPPIDKSNRRRRRRRCCCNHLLHSSFRVCLHLPCPLSSALLFLPFLHSISSEWILLVVFGSSAPVSSTRMFLQPKSAEVTFLSSLSVLMFSSLLLFLLASVPLFQTSSSRATLLLPVQQNDCIESEPTGCGGARSTDESAVHELTECVCVFVCERERADTHKVSLSFSPYKSRCSFCHLPCVSIPLFQYSVSHSVSNLLSPVCHLLSFIIFTLLCRSSSHSLHTAMNQIQFDHRDASFVNLFPLHYAVLSNTTRFLVCSRSCGRFYYRNQSINTSWVFELIRLFDTCAHFLPFQDHSIVNRFRLINFLQA